MTKNQRLYINTNEDPSDACTRQQDDSASVEVLGMSLLKFIDKLWEGVVESFKHNDTTNSISCWYTWSEAPAESIKTAHGSLL